MVIYLKIIKKVAKMSIFKKIVKGITSNSKSAATPPKVTFEQSQTLEPIEQDIVSSKIKKYKVAGVSHYKENVLSFASKNPQYSFTKKEMIASDLPSIYEFNFKTGKTTLIPEPTNPHDPNAVKVIIDEKHVGYIKKGSCKHILNLLNQNRIEKIESEIGGGSYKTLELNGDGDLILEHGYKEYHIVVSITER